MTQLTSWQTQLQILTAVVKLFLKKPDQSQAQGLVQKIFQAATAENDNPDVRDRAYVYWRLLSSNPQIAQNIVLSDKPPITTTIQSLPPALLDQLLGELSTLASVYHKPPETFVGGGKYGADTVQKAAIESVYRMKRFWLGRMLMFYHREQMQNARENPLAAAAAAAAVSGALPPSQNNAENLLDIDFDGAAPASIQKEPQTGFSGLEGLAGTPQRTASPAVNDGIPAASAPNDMDDLMGAFGDNVDQPDSHHQDVMNGFASLDLSSVSQPPPPQQQLANDGGGKKTNEDLLGLF